MDTTATATRRGLCSARSDRCKNTLLYQPLARYLQVGAFANPDAAELLRSKLSGMVSAPVFISSIVHPINRHCIGCVWGRSALRVKSSKCRTGEKLRMANLGSPSLVTARVMSRKYLIDGSLCGIEGANLVVGSLKNKSPAKGSGVNN